MPEVTADHIRLPSHTHSMQDCRTRTLTISAERGIKALYCGTHKVITTYLFERDKGWNMDDAKDWLTKNKEKSAIETIQAAMREAMTWVTNVASGLNADKHEPVVKRPNVRVLTELPRKTMEPPEWIQVLPAPGKWNHPVYGEIEITEERLARFYDNFKNAIYQEKIPLDAEHESKLSGATGWYADVELRGEKSDGGLWGKVDWNNRGKSLLADDRYAYFSPEWYDEWEDPATGKVYQDVLVGGAITTRPFFKEGSLAPLGAMAAGETALFAVDEEKRLVLVTKRAEESLDGQASAVRNAFYQKTQRAQYAYDHECYVRDVFADYVVCEDGEKLFRVPYTSGDDGIAFAPREEWQQVEMAYQPVAGSEPPAPIAPAAADTTEHHEENMATEPVAAIGMTEEQIKEFTEMKARVSAFEDTLAAKDGELKAATEARTAAETALATEREARVTREFAEKAAVYDRLPIGKDELAGILRWASEDTERAGKLEALLKACNEAMGKSKLFDEIGSSTAPAKPVDAEAEIERMIGVKMAEKSIKYADAMRAVQSENPELFARRATELAVRDRASGDA